jgi:hypothetical protein
MMDYRQWEVVTAGLDKTKRAIISLGCSFAGGEGAYDQELLEGLKWKWLGHGKPIIPLIDDATESLLFEKYAELEIDDGKTGNPAWPDRQTINFRRMFYKNSFVNVLAHKYLEGKYTGVNFGMPGKGNRASIKNLHIWPYDWSKLDSIIVIYCPSALERFDMAKDDWKGYSAFTTLYPHPQKGNTPRANMWNGYSRGVHSDKNAVLEQIMHFMELKQWCDLHNAKLIITPAFDRSYNRSFFETALFTQHKRNDEYELTQEPAEEIPGVKQHLTHLIDQWAWEDMFKPDGVETFMDLCLIQEQIPRDRYLFQRFLGQGSPKKWITHCSHPSAKAHDLFASLLHKTITDGKYS